MSKTILIIEDEISLQKAMVQKLEREGFNMLTANNGKTGLDLAIAEKPDLILLDIIMPVMDGVSMLKELRKDPWGADALVIFLTNLTDAEKVEEVEASGVTDYLIKSDWKIEDVVEKVQSVI